MAYRTIEAAREHDRLRNKDPKRRAYNNAWQRKRKAEDPEFHQKALDATARWMSEHKEENNEYRAKWAKDHRFKNYADAREYEFAREMKKYSTTIEGYRDKLIAQSGLCAICNHLNHSGRGELHRLQVDHDHSCCDLKTKSCGQCLRGLLCETCNMNLSYLEKFLYEAYTYPVPYDGSWLGRALAYLTKYRVPRFWRMK